MKYLPAFGLSVLLVIIPVTSQAIVCGDVDGNGSKTATDALLLLQSAVGQPVALMCPAGGGLLQTGQTTCYTRNGAVVACAGTGQDGDVKAGQARTFTNNGDGTITDNTTGLMWETQCAGPTCGVLHDKNTQYTWEQAFTSHVAILNSMNFAGHNDWRVPNLTALESLVNYQAVAAEAGGGDPVTYGAFNTCAADCDVTNCSCTALGIYWSSTTFTGAPFDAWNVFFLDGGIEKFDGKDNRFQVRAVRGGL